MKSPPITRSECSYAFAAVPNVYAFIIAFIVNHVVFWLELENVCRRDAGVGLLFDLSYSRWTVIVCTYAILSVLSVLMMYKLYDYIEAHFDDRPTCNHTSVIVNALQTAILFPIAIPCLFLIHLRRLALKIKAATVGDKKDKEGSCVGLSSSLVVDLHPSDIGA